MNEKEEKYEGPLLEIKGIGPVTAAKLVEKGITTVENVAVMRSEELADVLGVSNKVAKDIVNDAKNQALDKAIILSNMADLIKHRKEVTQRISTGSSQWDLAMKGGVPTEAITVLKGQYASGKSQVCYQLLVNCLKLLKRKVAWIETETGTFVPDRVSEMAKAISLEVDPINDVLYIGSENISTPYSLFLCYERLAKAMQEKKLDIGLIVIDSFSAPFRAFYAGREMLPDRCLAPNSKILMADGTLKRIYEIKIGDKIKGYSQGKLVDSIVLQTFRNPVKNIVKIGNLIASENHWFLTLDGYIRAKDINNTSTLISVRNCNEVMAAQKIKSTNIRNRFGIFSWNNRWRRKHLLQNTNKIWQTNFLSSSGHFKYKPVIIRFYGRNRIKDKRINLSKTRKMEIKIRMEICGNVNGKKSINGSSSIFKIKESPCIIITGNNKTKRRFAIKRNLVNSRNKWITSAFKENQFQRKKCRIFKRTFKSNHRKIFYDLMTTTGNYIAEGLVVHNSKEEARHLGFLDHLAKKYNLAIVMTAQVMDIPDPGLQLAERVKSGHTKRMYGGNVLEHGGTYLISLQQMAGVSWEAIIFDAPDIPRTAFRFKIIGAGIRDA